jgi:glucokinase
MYYIGVDLGGTNIAVGIVDENHKIVKKGSVPTLPDRGAEPIVHDMAMLAKSLMDDLSLTTADVAYAGIASPGIANRATGVVEYSCNLPFRDFPIAKVFQKYLPVKAVYVENDANAAALAEALAGAAKGTSISVMVTLGTGVGGGIIIDGKVFSGFNAAGAELGHMVIEKGGRQCGCGRRGCWETYSSATGLTNMTREKVNELMLKGIPSLMVNEFKAAGKVTARTAFDAMKKGDKAGSEVVDEYISYMACGIANIINIFQPEVLSIGGGICNEKNYLLDPLLALVDREQYTRDNAHKTVIKIAEMGNDAGIVGAAGLGL